MNNVPTLIGATGADTGVSMARDKDSLFACFGPAADQARRA